MKTPISLSRFQKAAGLLGVLGSVLWLLAVFAREADASLPPWGVGMRNVLPNFGACLLGVGLAFQLGSLLRKKPLADRSIYWVCAGMMGVLVMSELVHMLLGAFFDEKDLLASLAACGLLLLVYALLGEKQASAPDEEEGTHG